MKSKSADPSGPALFWCLLNLRFLSLSKDRTMVAEPVEALLPLPSHETFGC